MWDVRKKVNSVVIWNITNSTNEFQKQHGPGCAKHGEEKPGSVWKLNSDVKNLKTNSALILFVYNAREQRKLSKKMLINK